MGNGESRSLAGIAVTFRVPDGEGRIADCRDSGPDIN